ncbi:hypothetical protein HYW55_00225 [Candidatus Gottesmanbacteria bacterium]|nr:hypothetical protein [Candidatus Gottesmanbacteria bacterium]
MSLYLGPFYFHDRDVFLLLGIALLVGGWLYKVELPFGSITTLIYLSILFLLIKGFIRSEKENTLLILFITSLLLTFFVPITITLLFIFFAVVIFRVLRLI